MHDSVIHPYCQVSLYITVCYIRIVRLAYIFSCEAIVLIGVLMYICVTNSY